ncbi:MAG: hypothetical protein KGZ88_01830 [Methylomicrobium sp.]|nr:hypothetical protein [Methylomicrobium sp.]PPD24041.1 MAG: hypothetical protein CTY24_02455 [Methylobacter sp.]
MSIIIKTKGVRWITFIPPPGEALYPVVWIGVSAWQKSDLYITPGGGWAGNPERYDKFGKWMERKEPVQIASLGIVNNVIEFNDGRHRFAWLRDHGVTVMPVHVDPDKVELVKNRFGVAGKLD